MDVHVVRNSGIICLEQVCPCPGFSKRGEGQNPNDISYCFSNCVFAELQKWVKKICHFIKKNNKHCALNFALNFKGGD